MLIAIEGIDGSGKGTQAARLVERLRGEGHSVTLIGFPRYDKTFFGARVGEFLNGRYGSLAEVDPFLVSLLFAGDRLESKAMLLESLAANDFVVLDRYVASNVAHQAAKRDCADRDVLRTWIEQVEYAINGLPRADRTILLDLPAGVASSLVARKSARNYTDRKADLQEADTAYQENVRQMYLDLARNDPSWTVVPVIDVGRLRSIETIAHDVRHAV